MSSRSPRRVMSHTVLLGRIEPWRSRSYLKELRFRPDAVVEAAAQDGFVTQLPRDLVYGNDDIVAYMAIEVADTPWPPIPGKDKSAGPFYIVWLGDQASSVPIMKWPYQVVSLSVQEAPAKRWPSLAVDPMLPALHPARDGQTIFVNRCFTCHTMNQDRRGLAPI